PLLHRRRQVAAVEHGRTLGHRPRRGCAILHPLALQIPAQADSKLMRARFLLIPPAIFASAHAYAGAFYLNVGEAQELMYPGQTFTEDFRTIPVKDMEMIYEESRVRVTDPTFHMWRVSNGEWFIIDQVIGRDDTITYAIALDKTGMVKSIEVMEC